MEIKLPLSHPPISLLISTAKTCPSFLFSRCAPNKVSYRLESPRSFSEKMATNQEPAASSSKPEKTECEVFEEVCEYLSSLCTCARTLEVGNKEIRMMKHYEDTCARLNTGSSTRENAWLETNDDDVDLLRERSQWISRTTLKLNAIKFLATEIMRAGLRDLRSGEMGGDKMTQEKALTYNKCLETHNYYSRTISWERAHVERYLSDGRIYGKQLPWEAIEQIMQ